MLLADPTAREVHFFSGRLQYNVIGREIIMDRELFDHRVAFTTRHLDEEALVIVFEAPLPYTGY